MDNITTHYFEENPSAKYEVLKAAFAFHMDRHESGAHAFSSSLRSSPCQWCGRSREEVRYDDLPPECTEHQEPPDIKGIIEREERAFMKLLARSEAHIPKLVSKMGLSGKTLAYLHHTHGYDQVCFEHVIEELTPELLDDYEKEMAAEAARSRGAQTKTIIEVQLD
jgi:hypothetical protein